MRIPFPGNERGMILIEVIVSMVLLAGGMVGALQMLIVSQNGLNSSRERVHAAVLAQAFIEEMQALSFDNLTRMNSRGEEVIEGVTREWEMTSGPMGLGGVTLRVVGRWMDRKGRVSRVEIKLFRPSGMVP